MKRTVKRAAVLYALVIFFLGGVVYLCVQFGMNGPTWATSKMNKHIYSNGTVVNAGTIYDYNGVALAESKNNKRVFPEGKTLRKAILHVVGDTSGVISTGTHNLYRDNLSGYSYVSGIHNLKRTNKGSDIKLNIDSEACKVAYEALGDYNGTALVYNYKTGQLMCSVSKPSYDVNNVPDDLRTNEKYEGVFLDKAVSGIYTPGSIMKLVTAISAIENIPDIYSQTFECDGEYQTGDGVVQCNGEHGTITFQEALNQSCNCAFADISIQLGATKLLNTANSLGFNKRLKAKEIPLTMSRFNPSTSSKAELGWAGIGQSTTYINPTHYLALVGAIANGGIGYAPDRINSLGLIGDLTGRQTEVLVKMNPETANALKRMMRTVVTDKYGDDRFPDLQMCGKTGTAQIDGKVSNSVFAGFSQRSDLPLAVIVIAENAGWGSGVASSVANAVLQYFLENYVR